MKIIMISLFLMLFTSLKSYSCDFELYEKFDFINLTPKNKVSILDSSKYTFYFGGGLNLFKVYRDKSKEIEKIIYGNYTLLPIQKNVYNILNNKMNCFQNNDSIVLIAKKDSTYQIDIYIYSDYNSKIILGSSYFYNKFFRIQKVISNGENGFPTNETSYSYLNKDEKLINPNEDINIGDGIFISISYWSLLYGEKLETHKRKNKELGFQIDSLWLNDCNVFLDCKKFKQSNMFSMLSFLFLDMTSEYGDVSYSNYNQDLIYQTPFRYDFNLEKLQFENSFKSAKFDNFGDLINKDELMDFFKLRYCY